MVLVQVARALAGIDPARARALLGEAERIARTITDHSYRTMVLVQIVQALAGTHPAEAEHLARTITDPFNQSLAFAYIARAIS
jgi:hypothetical protein